MPGLSVVLIARDEGAELRRTVENLEDTLPERAEIIVVDDGSKDRSARFLACRRSTRLRLYDASGLGVAKARNFGARHARGDVLVFADAHIRVERDWWKPLIALLHDPRIGAAAPGVAGMRPDQPAGYGLSFRSPALDTRWFDKPGEAAFPALILPGCCLAVRRQVLRAVGGWDRGLYGVGGNDNEFCLRLWLLGYRLMVAPDVVVRHLFRRRSRVPMPRAQFLHNKLRLALLHFKPERIGKVFTALQDEAHLGAAVSLLTSGDAMARRIALLASRVKNDDWCFRRFGLTW